MDSHGRRQGPNERIPTAKRFCRRMCLDDDLRYFFKCCHPRRKRLRLMPVELLRFPAQVLKVRVAGFKAPSARAGGQVLPYSPEWSVKATWAMVELLHGEITATVVKGSDMSSDLTVSLLNQEGHYIFLPLLASGLVQLQ